MTEMLTPSELESSLREIGRERYHHRHPFHLLMHEGKLTRPQLRAWALNRYYYQSRIPIKDAIILSKSEDVSFRRSWIKRITDHDGAQGTPGGIEKWIKLGEATGASRDEITSLTQVLPGTRFAVDGYVQFVSQKSLLEAVASSLTELFSTDLITLRVGALRKLYPWLSSGLDYFEGRLSQAPEDAAFALEYVTKNAKTPAEQQLVIDALKTKCAILWSQLDALYTAYVDPGELFSKKPQFIRNCRLNNDLLLMPEGALRLRGTGTEIARLCDGKRSVGEIFLELKSKFAADSSSQIATDGTEFLKQLREKRVLDFL